MSASVEIYTQTAENVVSVPIQSVSTRDRELGKEGATADTTASSDEVMEVVFIYMPGDTVLMRTVETGIQDNDYIQIKSGIAEGDDIVIGPFSAVSKVLKQGDKVVRGEKKEKDNDESDDKEED